MILYHAISTYQLLTLMVHRRKYHSDDKAYIILPSYIRIKFPHYRELEGQFFDRVITFENSKFNTSDELFLENIDIQITKLLKEHHVELEQCKEIIVGCAHYYFGIFLAKNGIPFTFLEDSCGVLSKPEVLENIISKLSVQRNEMCKELGLYNGKNKAIKRIMCNVSVQKVGLESDKLFHFDVVEEMGKLDRQFLDKILTFFGVTEKIEIEKDSMIILTQHFANLKLLTFDQQKEIYKLIADYFAEGYPLVFKKHPDDLMYYEQLLPGSTVIEKKFPSELLPFVFTNVPKKVMTVTSSSILSLTNYFENPISFSMHFETSYPVTHRYYLVLRMITQYFAGHQGAIYSINADDRLIDNLLKHTDLCESAISHKQIGLEEFNDTDNSVLIVDDFCDENIVDYSQRVNELLARVKDSAIVFIMNSLNMTAYYDYPNKQVMNHLVPIEINFAQLRQIDDAEYSEVIYAYTRDKHSFNMINEFEYERGLKYLDIKVSKKSLTEEEIKIKVLEGILKATENRLEYYIQLESELREKLNFYEKQ